MLNRTANEQKCWISKWRKEGKIYYIILLIQNTKHSGKINFSYWWKMTWKNFLFYFFVLLFHIKLKHTLSLKQFQSSMVEENCSQTYFHTQNTKTEKIHKKMKRKAEKQASEKWKNFSFHSMRILSWLLNCCTVEEFPIVCVCCCSLLLYYFKKENYIFFNTTLTHFCTHRILIKV